MLATQFADILENDKLWERGFISKLCLQVSVLIIHWHCFQVSYARAQLAKDINLYMKLENNASE